MASTIVKQGPQGGGGGISPSIVDAKGDLIVASAANTVARFPVSGNNGWVLTEDSGEALGVKWAAPQTVTVSDTSSINLTLAGSDISGVVIPGGVDHNSLANLTTGDPHTQYPVLAPTTTTRNLISAPTATAIPLALSSSDGSTINPILVVRNGVAEVLQVRASMNGNDFANAFLHVQGTLPSAPSVTVEGVVFDITGTGSTAQDQRGLSVYLEDGYTGIRGNFAGFFANFTTGAAGITPIVNGRATFGSRSLAQFNTAGTNVGTMGTAGNGLTNISVLGANILNSAANGVHIGVAGVTFNSASGTPIRIGGYFRINTAGADIPAQTVNAGLIADNGGTTDAIALFRDNGTLVWSIPDGGTLTAADAINMAFGTGTGTKIATATNQKLGFWNTAPVVQPTNAIAAAAFVANTSGIVDDTATWGGYTAGQVVAALKLVGILA